MLGNQLANFLVANGECMFRYDHIGKNLVAYVANLVVMYSPGCNIITQAGLKCAWCFSSQENLHASTKDAVKMMVCILKMHYDLISILEAG